ncbi:glycosyltransferase family 2 protein [Flavobacterium capsici]|uniref:Glycosyltransferase n=1 Tax=Flavobacterium capsici TaxID=3075618 RepID=A0AA96F7N1_9FLAO|nr:MULTISPECIES: glycosyltransferase [unclassified Flavobacterium]WNM20402.1 glycosyltransferase [Flavobacterium sp. PMR2A8]WNM23165.1 glycosyltransferase [Flavobacterium sp. PMTSA4]
MNFTLIVCTYMRPNPLLKLLSSVKEQTLYPNEIIIVDGSTDLKTKEILEINHFENLNYFLVDENDRGLTKQRNYGIRNSSKNSKIICFLDDDTILEKNYFEELISTYDIYPEALGVGGFITNEVNWEKVTEDYVPNINEFFFDGWKRKEGSRFVLRKKLGLDSNLKPGYLPEFSNGRSVGFLPPSDKIYQVEQLKGGVSSFKRIVFDTFQFSPYFEGYGLYEDADFTLRVSKTGTLYVNTKARLSHFHDFSGRPNKFRYGKMVVRNGWYVWRVKFPNPSIKARIKWNAIVLLLTFILLKNVFKSGKGKEAISEFFGRISGWFSLIIKIK